MNKLKSLFCLIILFSLNSFSSISCMKHKPVSFLEIYKLFRSLNLALSPIEEQCETLMTLRNAFMLIPHNDPAKPEQHEYLKSLIENELEVNNHLISIRP